MSEQPQESSQQERLKALAGLPGEMLTMEELHVIDRALKGYGSYLGSLSSPKHQRLKEQMLDLRRRLTRSALDAIMGKLASNDLTFDDVELMVDALGGFVRLTKRMVPQSAERDDALHGIKLLLARLEAFIEAMLKHDT